MDYKRYLKLLMPSKIREYLKSMQRSILKLEGDVNKLKAVLRTLEDAVDMLVESPTYIASNEFGFNGQNVRKEIFKELISIFNFRFIFETGSWTGNTTGFMAEVSELPVFSAELNRRYHSIAKMRLANFDNVMLELIDSREFIKKHAIKADLTKACSFFYLDAHGYDDLPIKQEIELIAKHWEKYVIMLDDFKVPGDKGYGYNDSGDGIALSIEYLKTLMNQYTLIPFFPSKTSSSETGRKRGCVVLTKHGELSKKLEKALLLNRFEDF